jgi:hypothetical protein
LQPSNSSHSHSNSHSSSHSAAHSLASQSSLSNTPQARGRGTEGEGHLTFISIQFRTATRSRRPAVLHAHTLIRCISVHMTEEQAKTHAIHNTKPRRNYRPRRSCQPMARSRVTVKQAQASFSHALKAHGRRTEAASPHRRNEGQHPAPRRAGAPIWHTKQLE